MADAPSSISPTLPRKAVSVRPIICSITRLIRIGYATLQIFLYEYVRMVVLILLILSVL